jgi:predicted metal-dependent HD superfamily phosphohydrolase
VLFGRKDRWLAGEKFDHSAFHAHFDAQRKAHRALHSWVFAQYSSQGRHYHNTEHLEQVVSLLYSFYPQVTAAALLAGWLHDVVYVPAASDNEERSAVETGPHLCARDLDLQPTIAPRVKELILYTKNHALTDDPEEQMMHDADMAVFGMSRDTYAQYAANILQEYAAFPEDAFRKGRSEFLQALLRSAEERGRFFYKPDPIFEKNVEANVRWELGILQGR